jgi:hypothetical protein
VKDLSEWIWCHCEGRYVKGVGCDWSLFGFFPVHRREVIDDRGGVDAKRRELVSVLYGREFALTFPDERDVNIIRLRDRASIHGGLPVFRFAAESEEL